MKRLSTSFPLASVLVLVLAVPALAQDEGAAPVGARGGGAASGMLERPLYVSLGLGPTIALDGGDVQFKIQEDIGYHLVAFGEHPGLFVGGSFAQSFVDYVLLQFDVRVGADFLLAEFGSLALMATPSLALGVGVFIVSYTDPFGVRQTNTDAAFNLQFAADMKLVMLEGLLAIWLRPLAFDFFIRNNSTTHYDILAGAQLNF